MGNHQSKISSVSKNQLSLSMPNPVDHDRLQQLLDAAGRGPVLITSHDSPDPDALASGLALATLLMETRGISSDLIYSGPIGRAENRAVLRLLTPEWQFAESFGDLHKYSAVALVDSQPGAGNNSLPSDLIPQIVIDHHKPLRPETQRVPFRDIRDLIGATTTILYQYLAAAEIEPDSRLATAMFYGVRSDTNGLARDATVSDGMIYSLLLSSLDHQLLHQVLTSGLAKEYFSAFDCGLKNARITGEVITTYLGAIHRPDLVSEMADLLVRLEHVNTALCLGYYNDVVYLSLRTGAHDDDAGMLVQHIIAGYGKAGGHGTIAGGQIPVNGRPVEELVGAITQRFLLMIGETTSSSPLIPGKREDCGELEG